MQRYFIEVAYKGTAYAGFQSQKNANTIQDEVEKAFLIYFRQKINLTGSSRTDKGVHALQNFFHADITLNKEINLIKAAYHINAILPPDIVLKSIREKEESAHCRFNAIRRTYRYSLYADKNPFLADRSYYYPYALNFDLLKSASIQILASTDFQSFSKKHVQVKTFLCNIYHSEWIMEGNELIYVVTGNRFLRGMVRGLVGTMLLVGRGKITPEEFKTIIDDGNPAKVDFSVPGHGLTLCKVDFL